MPRVTTHLDSLNLKINTKSPLTRFYQTLAYNGASGRFLLKVKLFRKHCSGVIYYLPAY